MDNSQFSQPWLSGAIDLSQKYLTPSSEWRKLHFIRRSSHVGQGIQDSSRKRPRDKLNLRVPSLTNYITMPRLACHPRGLQGSIPGWGSGISTLGSGAGVHSASWGQLSSWEVAKLKLRGGDSPAHRPWLSGAVDLPQKIFDPSRWMEKTALHKTLKSRWAGHVAWMEEAPTWWNNIIRNLKDHLLKLKLSAIFPFLNFPPSFHF